MSRYEHIFFLFFCKKYKNLNKKREKIKTEEKARFKNSKHCALWDKAQKIKDFCLLGSTLKPLTHDTTTDGV